MGILTDIARAFHGRTLLALDTETTGLDCRQEELRVISLSDGERTFILEPEHWADRDLFTRFLRREVYRKHLVVHNWMFDGQFLRENFPEAGWPVAVWDTMIAEQLLTAGSLAGVGLEQTLERRLGVTVDKGQQKFFVGQRGVPLTLPPEVRDYIMHDTRHLLRLRAEQEVLIGQHALDEVWALECDVLPVFLKLVERGVQIDLERFTKLFAEQREERARCEADLIAALTPHVQWQRIAKFDVADAKLKEYLAHEQVAQAAFAARWEEAPDPAWPEAWRDLTLDKDQCPRGCARYVREQMRLWRQEHKRPPRPRLDEQPINLGSSEQVRAALQDLGVSIESTRQQQLRLTLPSVADQETQRIIQLFLDWRKLDKRIVAFGDPLPDFLDRQGVLHGHFKPYGTRTGRPACEKPNLLQMPKLPAFRECFRAREGQVIVRFDYAQMELRIACELSQDQAMLAAFRKDLDLHTYTASRMYGCAYADVQAEQRKVAKIVNFGILYGMGAQSLQGTLVAEGISTTEREAEQHLRLWRESYPQAAAAITAWGKQALRHGWTETVLGRRQYFTHDRSTPPYLLKRIQRVGANHVIQGSNADTTKLAMTLIQPRLEALGGGLLLQVYDEIVAEAPESAAEAAADVVLHCMLAAAKSLFTVVPIGVDGEVSYSWAGTDPLLTRKEVA